MLTAAVCSLLTVGLASKHPYSYDAVFLEGCSCKDVCVTEITGTDSGCRGLAAMSFGRAKYDGKDFSGSRAAWAWGPGWVHLYVDATGSKLVTMTRFFRAALADWGKMDNVTVTRVTVSKLGASVQEGKLASLTVNPVFGKDGKSPVEHTNLSSVFHDRLSQGKIKKAWYREAGHEAEWAGSNAFFNSRCKMSGKV